MTVLN